LPADGTGPLELLFFLKYNLPASNILTTGKLLIEIFPQIAYPPAANGVLKCFFFMTVPSTSCTWINDHSDRTVIILYTPRDYNFKESEIPITITTVGADPGFKEGITLPPLVQRWIFHVHMFTPDTATIP
jgi:hypothetical protein